MFGERVVQEGIDCFRIMETRLTKYSDSCIAEFNHSRFSSFHSNQKENSGGGLTVIARHPLDLRWLWCHMAILSTYVVIRSSNRTLQLLTVFYRPTSTNTRNSINEFSDVLSRYFSAIQPFLL